MAEDYLKANGWNEWAKYVLMSLEELKRQNLESDKQITELQLSVMAQIGELSSEIKLLKSQTTRRASLYAAAIALLPSIGYLLFNLIK